MRLRKRGSRKSEDRWLVIGRICFRVTAVAMVVNYGYMFIRIDKSFIQASGLGQEVERQLGVLWGGAAQNDSQASMPRGPYTGIWSTADDSTSIQTLKEEHAEAKAQLELEMQQPKAASAGKQSPSWDEVSFQIDQKTQERDIRGDDVQDLAVPMPRGLHLAFIGDSLSRYQYLSLAHFLRYGVFPDPAAHPNFVMESTHKSWMDFFNDTNSALLPFERCDCFRAENRNIHALVNRWRENRYFYDPISENSLVFLIKKGWHPSTFTWKPGSIHQEPLQYTPQLPQYLPPSQPVEGDWLSLVDHLAGLNPRPHIVVLNSGLWKPKHLIQPEIQDKVVQRLKEHNMIGIYKTTTKRLDDPHPKENEQYEKILCRKMLCLDSSWTDYVSSDLYWDNLHFVEPIYKRLNIQLLQLLKEQNLFDAFTTSKVSPVLTGTKPLYGIADDKPDNEQLSHPHAGARFADGKLGLVVNPDPARMHLNGKLPLACPEGPFPGIEESGGYDALQKIRNGLIQSKQFIQEESSKGRKVPRILCMVYTHAGAHDRVRAISNTWGKDCDGFFAASTRTDHTIGAINLLHKGDEHYENMWQKARSIWAYAYDYYKDDYDYFHVCGDDAFVIPDNLRAYAMSKEAKRLEEGYIDDFTKILPNAVVVAKLRPRYLVFGAPHYRSGKQMLFPDGGPGYTFNKAALELFAEDALPTVIPDLRDPREDVFVGGYFQSKGHLVVDTRDSEGGARYIDTDLDHQSKVDGTRRGQSRLQPAHLERVFKIKWTYLMAGISSQTIAIHLKWSNFAEDMPGVIYRYYEMLHYNEANCNVAKGV